MTEYNFQVFTVPEFDIQQQIIDCEEEAISLGVVVEGGSEIESIYWSDGSSEFSRVVFGSGNLLASVFYGVQCSFDVDVQYSTNSVVDLIIDSVWFDGFYELSVVSGSDIDILNYEWNTGVTDSTILVKESGIYSVSVEDNNACIYELYIEVEIESNENVYIPNAFSPNNDGVNDTWVVYSNHNNLRAIENIEIFDRWGNIIHKVESTPAGEEIILWDGSHSHKEDINGKFFIYQMVLVFDDGREELKTGSLLVVL